jgi:hypothetical protein
LLHLHLDTAKLGLDAGQVYRVREGLSDTALGDVSGAALEDNGLSISLCANSTGVVVVKPQ